MNYLVAGLLIVGILGAFSLAFIAVSIYNGLIAIRENVNKSWANIDVILKQRYDEIPQLIKICEQYVEFEQGMIDRVLQAREKMVRGESLSDKAAGASELTAGLKGLLAVGESYPDLKSNTNFLQIQGRLSSLEENLADRREFYNDSVNVYNTRIQQFPDVFFAGALGMTRKELFKVEEAERKIPDLQIKFKR
jgi:LemA protein